MWPVGEIGTDPRMANNALGRDPATGKLTPQFTGRLQGYKKTIRRDEGSSRLRTGAWGSSETRWKERCFVTCRGRSRRL